MSIDQCMGIEQYYLCLRIAGRSEIHKTDGADRLEAPCGCKKSPKQSIFKHQLRRRRMRG